LLFGQNDYKKITAFADEQMANGNYNYALQFYQQAMSIDSSQYELLWKVSLCQQALKNYPKAAYYFAKVYAKEECRIYPSSLLNWAIMEKQCGHYEQAIELFKNAKKKYAKNVTD
jgi:tetratricopeptide (TPR) repeat protein